MPTPLVDASGVLASLACLQSWVQAARAYRRSTSGISVMTWSMLVFVSGLWVAYGVVFRVVGEVVGNSLFALGSLAIIAACARSGASVRMELLVAAGCLVAVLVPCIAFPQALGPVAVVATMAAYLPQAAIRSHDLGGVSVPAWGWTVAASTAWLVYGLGLHRVPVWAPNTVIIPTALVVAVRAYLSHRRSWARTPAPATDEELFSHTG